MIKELKGHSGSKVLLYKDLVIKLNYPKSLESVNILRALEKNNFSIPNIFYVDNNSIMMEYINGEDMITYLSNPTSARVERLIKFIRRYFDWCLENSSIYSFKDEVEKKIIFLSDKFPSIKNRLYEIYKEELTIPQGIIHGDFTLDNIIYSNDKFYLIDSNPTELNSIYFDGNKLLQDLDSYWFLFRNNQYHREDIKVVCNYISEYLKKHYDFLNKTRYNKFMLSRILPYSTEKPTIEFLLKEINK